MSRYLLSGERTNRFFAFFAGENRSISCQLVGHSVLFSGTSPNYADDDALFALFVYSTDEATVANELVYQTPASTTNVIAGSITIPANTSAGVVRLRLIAVSSSSGNPGDPCGSYKYGEAEDYQLNVIAGPGCTVMTTTKDGNWNDPTVWSCNRVPVSIDVVSVGHLVTVPANAICNALTVSYTANGKILFNAGGKLSLGPSN